MKEWYSISELLAAGLTNFPHQTKVSLRKQTAKIGVNVSVKVLKVKPLNITLVVCLVLCKKRYAVN